MSEMREVTLKVPDNKLAFIIDLTKQLGFEAFVEDVEINDIQKETVRERIRKTNENPGRLLAWGDVKDSFKFD